MRRFVNTILLLLVILPLVAQAPDWYNAASRKMLYNPELYYTGFVEGSKQSNETLEAAVARIKDAARVELAATIRTSVEQILHNRTQSELLQTSTDFNEQIRETFISETRITSNIRDIPGLKIESYHIPNTNEIVAFAYVKRVTLINQLTKRIALNLGKVESVLSQAETLSNNGEKVKARTLLEANLQQFEKIEEAQNLLVVVDENADEESLLIDQTRELKRKFDNMIAQLRNGIKVYLQCDAKLFSSDHTTFDGALRGELSQIGCTFVDSIVQSDWTIFVSASTREYMKSDFGNITNYYSYVDTRITIEKTKNHQKIYENSISEKGGDTRNFIRAAQEAYKYIVPQIGTVIKQQIMQ